MFGEIHECGLFIVELEAEAASRRLLHFGNSCRRVIVDLIAIKKLDMIGDNLLDHQHIAAVRIVFLTNQISAPNNSLANVSKSNLGELAENRFFCNGELADRFFCGLPLHIFPFVKELLHSLYNSVILL